MIRNFGDGPETVYFNVRCFRWPCYSDSSHLKYLETCSNVELYFCLMAFMTLEHLVTPCRYNTKNSI
jgi:hypothetical protein